MGKGPSLSEGKGVCQTDGNRLDKNTWARWTRSSVPPPSFLHHPAFSMGSKASSLEIFPCTHLHSRFGSTGMSEGHVALSPLV